MRRHLAHWSQPNGSGQICLEAAFRVPQFLKASVPALLMLKATVPQCRHLMWSLCPIRRGLIRTSAVYGRWWTGRRRVTGSCRGSTCSPSGFWTAPTSACWRRPLSMRRGPPCPPTCRPLSMMTRRATCQTTQRSCANFRCPSIVCSSYPPILPSSHSEFSPGSDVPQFQRASKIATKFFCVGQQYASAVLGSCSIINLRGQKVR